jgi:hypothetical protein
MNDDEFSGEKSVVQDQPTAADYEPEVRFFRALAAVGVVYGTAGMVLLPYGLLRFHQGAIPGDYRVNILEGPLQSPSAQAIWLFSSSLLGAGLAMTLMIGAIGGLRLKSWSQPVLRLWAIASIIVGAVGSYFFFRWLLPPWRDQWAQVRGVDDSLVNLGGWIVGSLLAVAMLIVISRPRVRDALRRGGTIIERQIDAAKLC